MAPFQTCPVLKLTAVPFCDMVMRVALHANPRSPVLPPPFIIACLAVALDLAFERYTLFRLAFVAREKPNACHISLRFQRVAVIDGVSSVCLRIWAAAHLKGAHFDVTPCQRVMGRAWELEIKETNRGVSLSRLYISHDELRVLCARWCEKNLTATTIIVSSPPPLLAPRSSLDLATI